MMYISLKKEGLVEMTMAEGFNPEISSHAGEWQSKKQLTLV